MITPTKMFTMYLDNKNITIRANYMLKIYLI